MESSAPLIITGMHRSGTSLLAKFIHHSGIDLGDHLLGASRGNVYGHYEDAEILEFQRSILQREFGHQMWVSKPPHLGDADRIRARALISERQHKTHWGWKDPRTSMFLSFWASLLPNADYLFVVRHPDLVVESLSRRNGTKFYHFWMHNTFLKSWLSYNHECYYFWLKGRHHCTLVVLERVLRDPPALTNLLSQRLAFAFDEAVFRSMYDSSAIAHNAERRLLMSPPLRANAIAFWNEVKRHADI